MPFYAVAIGRERGIYQTRKEFEEQVNGYYGPVHGKFDRREDAVKFMEENSRLKRVPSFRGEPFTKNDIGSRRDALTSDGSIVAYTDGSCVNNKCGMGVYWRDNHPSNVSRPLNGEQTNVRAEIQAAIAAIKQAKQNGHNQIIVRTDLELLIDCATHWIDRWLENGWITFEGTPVKNKQDFVDLINVMSVMERVTWEKVAGHGGIHGNQEADKLARKATNQ